MILVKIDNVDVNNKIIWETLSINQKLTSQVDSASFTMTEKPEVNEGDPKTAKRTRFIGHVDTDATRFFRSTDDIEKEILKHLNLATGTKVKITIHIEATNHEGFSQDTERTLKENGRTLGFGNVEFD